MDLKRGVDFIGVTVCFIVHDGRGNILLQKRSKNTRDEQGKWDIGGGAVEFGETLDEAVRREVTEELCSPPLDVEFLMAYEAHRNHDGKPTHWIALLHSVQINPELVKIGEPDRIDEIDWFNSINLPSPLHSMFETAYNIAKERGIIK
jgi:8-oxo-dGTP diphosphatase